MEKQYSVQFFQSLVENLQDICRSYINFSKFVEVTGYISVEIDNAKKERYVLSELLHVNGHTLSESYCTKAFKTCYSWNRENSPPGNRMKDKREHGNSHSTSIQQRFVGQNRMNRKDRQVDKKYPKQYSQQTEASMEVEIIDDLDSDRSVFSCATTAKRRRESSNNTPKLFSSGNPQRLDYPGKAHSSMKTSQSHHSNQERNSYPAAVTENTTLKVFSNTSSDYLDKYSRNKSQQESRQKSYPINQKTGSGVCPAASTVVPESVFASSRCSEVKVTLPAGLDPPEDVKVKLDPEASNFMDEDTIDLDLYEEDLNDSQTDFSSFMEDQVSFSSLMSESPGKICSFRKGNPQTNPYIEKTTRFAVNKLDKYCHAKTGQHLELFSMTPEELDSTLSDFFSGLKKKDGNPYDPRSLRTMQCNIDKHLKNGGYSWSILKDPQFGGSRETLKSLLGDRVTNKPQFRYNPLNEQDIETLFLTEQLGLHNPESLLNSMWLLNINFFGIKSLTEHFHLKWGDMVLMEDDDGSEYLQHMLKDGHLGGPRIYAKPDDQSRCFVHLYKEYTARRPVETLEHSSPFYLNVSKNVEFECWYISEPLSWYKLASLWKKMVMAAGLPQDKRPMFNVHLANTG